MASHRLKRTMRGALAASAVVAAVSFTPAPATADTPSPNPPVSSDPVQAYQQLSKQADALNEQINGAKNDLANKQAEQRKAADDLAGAKQAQTVAQAQEDQFRASVDSLTQASFEGARFNQLSALLTGNSARDFLDRATSLQDLADTNFAALNKLAGAVQASKAAADRASADEQKAQDAANAANALVQQLNQQGQQLNQQINQVQSALQSLNLTQRKSLGGIGLSGVFIAPPGIRGAAMNIALGERGVPYSWGGASPSGFDCSGLVLYSYAKAGMSGLPHSAAAQQGMGQAVSRADLQPGDLVFFGSPAHHVGIYVGGGNMVDAPDFGQVVKVEPLDSDYSGARRLGA